MKDEKLINSIRIAKPCDVPWDSMDGDARVRYCGQCKLNVYALSEMSTREAANLLREGEGKACVRLFYRKDGTVITDDCPVGLRKYRAAIRIRIAAALALMVTIGLMTHAQAQGLVGAAQDPRYGESGVPDFDHSGQRVVAGWLVAANVWTFTQLIRKRISIAAIALGLMLISVGFGLALGLSTFPLGSVDLGI